MTKKIYIAGKISGEPIKKVKEKFEKEQTILEIYGYEVVNPVKLVEKYLEQYKHIKLSDEDIWKIAMKQCIKQLVDCDGVLLLPCHLESRGALIEKQLAMNLDIPTYHDINKFIERWNS